MKRGANQYKSKDIERYKADSIRAARILVNGDLSYDPQDRGLKELLQALKGLVLSETDERQRHYLAEAALNVQYALLRY